MVSRGNLTRQPKSNSPAPVSLRGAIQTGLAKFSSESENSVDQLIVSKCWCTPAKFGYPNFRGTPSCFIFRCKCYKCLIRTKFLLGNDNIIRSLSAFRNSICSGLISTQGSFQNRNIIIYISIYTSRNRFH